MDSFHRADWIGLAQALGGMLAVAAAFLVSSLQARHSERLRRSDSLERLDGLARLVEMARAKVELVLSDADHQVDLGGQKILTVEKLQGVAVVFDALASVPIEIAPSATAVRALLHAKIALVHAKNFVPDLGTDPSARFDVSHVGPLRDAGQQLRYAAIDLRKELARLEDLA